MSIVLPTNLHRSTLSVFPAHQPDPNQDYCSPCVPSAAPAGRLCNAHDANDISDPGRMYAKKISATAKYLACSADPELLVQVETLPL